MYQHLNWEKANLGAAIGKVQHMQTPDLRVILDHMHMGLSYQSYMHWQFRYCVESRCDLPMDQLYENTKELWERAS